ncbi:NAD(P)H-dependent oxidoreductase [Candidatus Saccharibacteria bacterium oral taxon 488]|nr:NAD(P)H-dependent oxidoreductase [Candidatus Saccharibacteria bacterium oral taxon 488]
MTSKPTTSAADITKALDFRHACKKFDADKKISDQDMELILEAIRLTPTSYGFEQFDVIVAQDQQLRQGLKKCAPINKPRFDASHFLIFTAKTADALSDHIDHILRDVKRMNLVERTAYKTFWKQWAKKDFKLMDTPDGLHQWSAHQAYIALGFAMLVAAERGIDSCPIEGFSIDQATEVLTTHQLIDPAKDLPVLMLALGYASRSDRPHPRSRRPLDEMVRWY